MSVYSKRPEASPAFDNVRIIENFERTLRHFSPKVCV